MNTTSKEGSLFELDGVPKLSQAFPLALQHVVAMIVGCVTPAIMLLLFALGISVGSNELLMQSLPRLGGAALALTVAGILGSFVCVALIRRFFTKTPTPAGISPQQNTPDAEAPNHEG